MIFRIKKKSKRLDKRHPPIVFLHRCNEQLTNFLLTQKTIKIMKKLFLLSLSSVLFFSVFCQESDNGIEVITKISINKNIDDDEFQQEILKSPPIFPTFKWIKYRMMLIDPMPTGTNIFCAGFGSIRCLSMKELFSLTIIRGIEPEILHSFCNNLIEESEERTFNGEFRGSLTKKIAISNTQSYLIFQITWCNDPLKPYNGKTEIVISKIENFGLK